MQHQQALPATLANHALSYLPEPLDRIPLRIPASFCLPVDIRPKYLFIPDEIAQIA